MKCKHCFKSYKDCPNYVASGDKCNLEIKGEKNGKDSGAKNKV